MTATAVPGRFILFSSEEASRVRGMYGKMHRLDPIAIGDDRFIVGVEVLDEPAFARHIPFLASLTTCSLLKDDDDGRICVEPGSEKPGDPSVIDRVYVPLDRQSPLAVPPLPERGDWSEDALYKSVGLALSRWETFETEFANLFSALLSPSLDSTPALRAYGSIMAFEGRLNMVVAAAEAYFFNFPKEHHWYQSIYERSFNNIARQARELSSFRNKIAHGIVAEYSSPTGPVRGIALQPANYAKRGRQLILVPQGGTKPKYAFTSAEVNYFGERFWDLRIPTSRLWGHLYRYVETT